MKLNDIKTIAIVGAGDMGHGITELCAITGYEVYMKDIKQDVLDSAMGKIKKSLEILAQKNKIEASQVESILQRIHPVLDLSKYKAGIDFAVEAVPEIFDLKVKVFKELDELLPPHVVIATNTSNMSITNLGQTTTRPEKVVGMHFFNPVILMKPVEVIKGEGTDEDTYQVTKDLTEKIGKLVIPVLKDTPGFLFNRVQSASLMLLRFVLENQIVTHKQIYETFRNTLIHMGPYETMDFVGIDIYIHSYQYFEKQLGSEYKAPTWLMKLYEEGNLGKKTGKGIFDWSQGRPTIDMNDKTNKFNILDLLAVQINEATKLLEEGVITDLKIVDDVIKTGSANTRGILWYLKSAGVKKIMETCEDWAKELNVETFQPTRTLKEM